VDPAWTQPLVPVAVAQLAFGGGNLFVLAGSSVYRYSPAGVLAPTWPHAAGLYPITASAMAVDAVGQVVLAGNFVSPALPAGGTGQDAWVGKYDQDFVPLWSHQFGTASPDGATAVAFDPNGDVYVAGHTDGVFPGQRAAGSSDAFVREFDPAGAAIWSLQFGTGGDDFPRGLAAGTPPSRVTCAPRTRTCSWPGSLPPDRTSATSSHPPIRSVWRRQSR
jgi:hypothetical protein